MALLIGFAILLVVAVALQPAAAWVRLPFGAVAVALGFGAARALEALGVAVDVEADAFGEALLGLVIPVLLFDSALNLSLKGLPARAGALLWLALPGFLFAASSLALLLHWLPPPGTLPSWVPALLGGVLIACTDAAYAGAVVERFAATPGLRALLEGEALLTQLLTILLFATVLQFAPLGAPPAPDAARTVLDFFVALGGGLLTGFPIAVIGLGLLFTFRGAQACAVISLASFVFTYALATEFFHVSLAAALVTVGLVLGAGNRRFCHEQFMQDLWAFGGFLARAFVFLLAGFTFRPLLLQSHWSGVVLALVGLLATRALMTFLVLPRCTGSREMNGIARTAVFWAGQRGAMNLTLVLALPASLASHDPVQAVVLGAVLFSLLVQAPTLEPLLRLLDRRRGRGATPGDDASEALE